MCVSGTVLESVFNFKAMLNTGIEEEEILCQ